MHKIKDYFKLGAKYRLGSGTKILFWKDWWIGESPLCTRFPRLFDISSNHDILIAQAYSGDSWRLSFRRTFGQEELDQWTCLLQEIESLTPSVEDDQVSWALEPSGSFSVRSLYHKILHVSDAGVPKFFWSAKFPLKIKIFLWQLDRGRLPAGDQLVLRHGPSDGLCALCGDLEDTNHIFFNCSLAKFMWSAWRQCFDVSWNPISFYQWWLIVNTPLPKLGNQCGSCLQPRVGLFGISETSFLLKRFSLRNLLTVSLKLVSYCSNGECYTSLKSRPWWTS